jgi:hypothetical protein
MFKQQNYLYHSPLSTLPLSTRFYLSQEHGNIQRSAAGGQESPHTHIFGAFAPENFFFEGRKFSGDFFGAHYIHTYNLPSGHTCCLDLMYLSPLYCFDLFFTAFFNTYGHARSQNSNSTKIFKFGSHYTP